MGTSDRCHILYVDTVDTFFQEFLTALEENESIRIDTATSVTNAVESIENTSYDCLIAGQNIDWREFQTRVREYTLPIILLVNDVDSVSTGFESGVSDCLSRCHPELQASILSERLARGQYATPPDEQRKIGTYQQLLASDELVLYELDSNGTITMASQEFAERMGTSQQELLGSHVTEYLTQSIFEQGRELVEQLLADDDREWDSHEYEVDHGDQTCWYRDYLTPVVGEAGEFNGVLGVMFDISDHKARLEELELYETMIESIPEMVWAVDEHGNYIYANRGYEEYGIEPEDMIGENVAQFMKPDDVQRARQDVRETFYEGDGEKFIDRYEYEAKGQQIKSETHVSLLDSGSGDLEGLVGIAFDIDERVEREQRLNVVNRIFRHNIRNTLTVLNGGISIISEEVSGTAQEQVDLIEQQVKDLEQLIEKARDADKILRTQQNRRLTDLVGLIEKVSTTETDEDVTVETDLPERAEAYAIEGIEFAIENLIENAIQHNAREDLIVRISVEEDAKSVTITVEDNGTGIPEDETAAIEQGEEEALVHASGIGLWAVNWIVSRSRGELEFDESNELGGAAVRIRLSRQA